MSRLQSGLILACHQYVWGLHRYRKQNNFKSQHRKSYNKGKRNNAVNPVGFFNFLLTS